MQYEVRIKNEKKIFSKLPQYIKDTLLVLIDELREEGPEQPEWYNYSRLGENQYHCHLARKWVACWRQVEKSFVIEVYYAGSREKAPY